MERFRKLSSVKRASEIYPYSIQPGMGEGEFPLFESLFCDLRKTTRDEFAIFLTFADICSDLPKQILHFKGPVNIHGNAVPRNLQHATSCFCPSVIQGLGYFECWLYEATCYFNVGFQQSQRLFRSTDRGS